MVQIQDLSIAGVKLVTLKKFEDARGFFSETYNAPQWQAGGISDVFVQDNHSYNVHRHTVRGLHFQTGPVAQAKVVRVIRGAILDVAVDLRKSSPTFGQHVQATLTGDSWTCLYVPVGFAHGFCTLEPDTEVVYKVSAPYSPAHDAGLLWNDPALDIAWPVSDADAVLSERDRGHPRLEALTELFA